MKPYASYKASGVDWLGDVPSHWAVKCIKRLSAVRRGASPRPIDNPIYFDSNGEYGWVRIEEVTKSNGKMLETSQRLSDLGASLSVKLPTGSLFLSIAGTVGKPCITEGKFCIHDGFVYFPQLEDGLQGYLYSLFESGFLFGGLGKMGTQLNLNTHTVGDIKIPHPSLAEQHAIATYLDRETARVDALLQGKQALIALLREYRQSTISSAVTQGLNPAAPRKPSGIAWLGDIPKHWDIKKLKFVATVAPSNIDKLSVEGETSVKLCNYVDVYKNDKITSAIEFMPATASPEQIERFKLKVGDVVVTKDSESPWDIAVPTVIAEEIDGLVCGYHLAKITPVNAVGEYLAWAFRAKEINTQFALASNGITRYGLGVCGLSDGNFPVPPLAEQHAIAAHLDRETARIDALIAHAQAEITLLKELRAATIADAVLGRVDVRTA